MKIIPKNYNFTSLECYTQYFPCSNFLCCIFDGEKKCITPRKNALTLSISGTTPTWARACIPECTHHYLSTTRYTLVYSKELYCTRSTILGQGLPRHMGDSILAYRIEGIVPKCRCSARSFRWFYQPFRSSFHLSFETFPKI
jgi:hypothetical protein